MKKSKAVVVAVLLPCIAYGLVVAFTEQIFWNTSVPSGKGKRAALAIRDNVTPFQKWGSKQFTLPYLHRYYNEAWYFTQTDTENCKQLFLARLEDTLQRYPEVDLFLLAHSNDFLSWVKELSPENRHRLRLVYNSGCSNLNQGALWLSLGTKAYVGHPGNSLSSIFYFYFLRRWTRGATLENAINDSNRLMRSSLDRTKVLFGDGDRGKIMQESEAFCYGNKELRFQ